VDRAVRGIAESGVDRGVCGIAVYAESGVNRAMCGRAVYAESCVRHCLLSSVYIDRPTAP
jgi:hypothetical protein